ncbi:MULTISPECIES: hypothetical protein [unclassified Frankia]
MSGRDLSRRFYEQAVRPLAAGVPHAAALLGEGSEVLGFDDEVSTDHDFGPRVQLFVPPGLDTTPLDVALERLPAGFGGFPVVYPDSDTDTTAGRTISRKNRSSAAQVAAAATSAHAYSPPASPATLPGSDSSSNAAGPRTASG